MAKQFIRRGKEKFMFVRNGYCFICKKDNVDGYDVFGLVICDKCIKERITRLSPKTGDIKWSKV